MGRRNGCERVILAAIAAASLFSAAASMADEADLLGTAWLTEDIDRRGVIDRARTTLEFPKPGQVGGLAGCNRYFGPVTLDGRAMSIGNLASTRKMCANDALMNQEQRFLQTLSRAGHFEITHGGQIMVVHDEAGDQILRFSRIVDK